MNSKADDVQALVKDTNEDLAICHPLRDRIRTVCKVDLDGQVPNSRLPATAYGWLRVSEHQ